MSVLTQEATLQGEDGDITVSPGGHALHAQPEPFVSRSRGIQGAAGALDSLPLIREVQPRDCSVHGSAKSTRNH